MLWIVVAISVGGLLVGGGLWVAHDVKTDFAAATTRASATVEAVEVGSGGRAHANDRIDVQWLDAVGYARSHTIPVRDADDYEVGQRVSILYNQESADGRVFTVDEGPSLMLEDSEGFAIFFGLLASGHLLWSLFFMVLTWSEPRAPIGHRG